MHSPPKLANFFAVIVSVIDERDLGLKCNATRINNCDLSCKQFGVY